MISHLMENVMSKANQQNNQPKRKKTGIMSRLTGFNVGKTVVNDTYNTSADSLSRTKGLYKSLVDGENVASVEGHDQLTPEERFVESMRLHGKRERELPAMIMNTYRSGMLYLFLSVAMMVVSVVGIYAYQPTSFFGFIAWFGPLPLLMAMAFKHSYSNWMFRYRRLDSPVSFFLSGDVLPKQK